MLKINFRRNLLLLDRRFADQRLWPTRTEIAHITWSADLDNLYLSLVCFRRVCVTFSLPIVLLSFLSSGKCLIVGRQYIESSYYQIKSGWPNELADCYFDFWNTFDCFTVENQNALIPLFFKLEISWKEFI